MSGKIALRLEQKQPGLDDRILTVRRVTMANGERVNVVIRLGERSIGYSMTPEEARQMADALNNEAAVAENRTELAADYIRRYNEGTISLDTLAERLTSLVRDQ